jgi:hypothetical protein
MHVWDGILQKVHYNAVFEGGKRQEKALNAETQRKIWGKKRETEAERG